jgi:hypothetical protein
MRLTENQIRNLVRQSIRNIISEQESTREESKYSDAIRKLEVDTEKGIYTIAMNGESVRISDPEDNTIREPSEVEEAIGAMIIVTDEKDDNEAKKVLTQYIKKLFPKEDQSQSYKELIDRLRKFGSALLNK